MIPATLTRVRVIPATPTSVITRNKNVSDSSNNVLYYYATQTAANNANINVEAEFIPAPFEHSATQKPNDPSNNKANDPSSNNVSDRHE